ncbi:hypothetical protein ACOME3_008516 [Neoechinorhynchus agilis]
MTFQSDAFDFADVDSFVHSSPGSEYYKLNNIAFTCSALPVAYYQTEIESNDESPYKKHAAIEPISIINCFDYYLLPKSLKELARIPPVWIEDAQTKACLECGVLFTVTRRRHHCRSCGLIFCGPCSRSKLKMSFYEADVEKEDVRVCKMCSQLIPQVDKLRNQYADVVKNKPENNRRPLTPAIKNIRVNVDDSSFSSESCSVTRTKSPVSEDTEGEPSTSPTEVSKRSVSFVDGGVPGDSEHRVNHVCDQSASSKSSINSNNTGPFFNDRRFSFQVEDSDDRWTGDCFVPEGNVYWPPMIDESRTSFTLEPLTSDVFRLLTEGGTTNVAEPNSNEKYPLWFALNSNLKAQVQIVNFTCGNCALDSTSNERKLCWLILSNGMCTVGSDEVVYIIECEDIFKLKNNQSKVFTDKCCRASQVPLFIFRHMCSIYSSAAAGYRIMPYALTKVDSNALLKRDVGGFIYFRRSFQCLHGIKLFNRVHTPYLFGVSIRNNEVMLAHLFPIRLLLKLGAECQVYPFPLQSCFQRNAVYSVLDRSILSVLCDFKNLKFTVPLVPTLRVSITTGSALRGSRDTSIGNGGVFIRICRTAQSIVKQVVKASLGINILAFGAVFDCMAHAHLVVFESTQNDGYMKSFQKSEEKENSLHVERVAPSCYANPTVTGASFIVFAVSNSEKAADEESDTCAGLVEDGVIVRLSEASILELKQSLIDGIDFKVNCGPNSEIVQVTWMDNDVFPPCASTCDHKCRLQSPIDHQYLDIAIIHPVHHSCSRFRYRGSLLGLNWPVTFVFMNDVLDGDDDKNINAFFGKVKSEFRVTAQLFADAV